MPNVKKTETFVRYSWVDWSKFICITLMILCHTGLYSGGFLGKILAQVIYSFHMPAFFIISGFLYKPKAWWNTAKAFLLPVLFFSAIVLVKAVLAQYFRSGMINVSEIVDVNTYWCNCTGHGPLFVGLWFIFALMLCRFFMGDVGILRIFGKYYWIVGIICFLYVVVDNYFGLNYLFKTTYLYNAIVAMVFFTFGMFLKNTKVNFSNYSNLVCIILSAIAILLSIINGRIDMLERNFGFSSVLFYVNAIVASLSLFMWTSKLKQYEVIRLFSVGTLALLGSHMILHSFISPVLKGLGLNIEIVALISTTIIVLINYPIILLCSKKAKWVLGK